MSEGDPPDGAPPPAPVPVSEPPGIPPLMAAAKAQEPRGRRRSGLLAGAADVPVVPRLPEPVLGRVLDNERVLTPPDALPPPVVRPGPRGPVGTPGIPSQAEAAARLVRRVTRQIPRVWRPTPEAVGALSPTRAPFRMPRDRPQSRAALGETAAADAVGITAQTGLGFRREGRRWRRGATAAVAGAATVEAVRRFRSRPPGRGGFGGLQVNASRRLKELVGATGGRRPSPERSPEWYENQIG